MDDEEAAELAASSSPETIIQVVDEMEPDEAADFLGTIPPEKAELVLAALEYSDEIRPLLLHPNDSAGGLMISEFLAVRRRMTIAEVSTLVDAAGLFIYFTIDRLLLGL